MTLKNRKSNNSNYGKSFNFPPFMQYIQRWQAAIATMLKNKSSVYLFFYNLIETVGWSYILYLLVIHFTFATDGSLYESIKTPLFIFQNAAVLEIFHAVFRLVPSSPSVTIQQVFSRVMLVCGVLMLSRDAQLGIGLPLILAAWSVTEIIRYGYYTLNLVNAVPQFLLWLRYTLFIGLYPLGVTGELLCIYAACMEFRRNNYGVVTLPNYLNVTFNYPYLLMFLMALYIPLFPPLYMHMFGQRKKVLGKTSTTKVSTRVSKKVK
ncbi:hypothetical protein PPYR_09159 [Photinus pyralis]|uniref:Very-long-chain (3R)-3-hydroxyacyl-CoA dehydratase n=2 Tax=Photinus pyralis TaxID=7054 RepID=A0A5N4ALI5_PHOPY|nr:hypothetical protein PPYR_09159 [Photinus pyralis]